MFLLLLWSNHSIFSTHCVFILQVTNKNLTDTLEHYLTAHYDTHLDSMNRFNFALLSNVRDLFNFRFVTQCFLLDTFPVCVLHKKTGTFCTNFIFFKFYFYLIQRFLIFINTSKRVLYKCICLYVHSLLIVPYLKFPSFAYS